jgi:hypothetical protein
MVPDEPPRRYLAHGEQNCEYPLRPAIDVIVSIQHSIEYTAAPRQQLTGIRQTHHEGVLVDLLYTDGFEHSHLS